MNKKGHSIGAALISVASIYYFKKDILTEITIVTGIVIGSFMPDIDAEYSYFNSKFPVVPKLYKVVQKTLPENSITSHRGALFHSIYTLIPFIIFF